MVRTFGGVDAFCTAWADRLRHDLDGGGYAALRHLEAILRLSQYCAERRHRAVQDMTDAELEEAVAAYVKSPAVSM
jgi:hypothetical protein